MCSQDYGLIPYSYLVNFKETGCRMRVFGIMFGTLVIVLMSLGAIYFWGLGQVNPKYDHAFFEISAESNPPKIPWIVVPRSFSEELASHPKWIVWIDVFRDKNQTLVVDNKEGSVALTQVLGTLKGRRIILNIAANVEDIDRQLAEILPPFLDETPIVLQSEFDVVLRSTKESIANLPFGSSQSDRLRLNSFEGMAPWSGGLLPAATFHGDILITPLKWKAVPLLDANVIKEIHRRQKYVIVGPLLNQDEVHQAQSLGVDGYFIKDKAVLASLLLQAVAH